MAITSFEKAKEQTILRWQEIINAFHNLDKALNNECGLCLLYDYNCDKCEGIQVCRNLYHKFGDLMDDAYEIACKLLHLAKGLTEGVVIEVDEP